jgi:hypothetical protein
MGVVVGEPAQALGRFQEVEPQVPRLGVVGELVAVGPALGIDDDLVERRDADVAVGDQRDAVLDPPSGR